MKKLGIATGIGIWFAVIASLVINLYDSRSQVIAQAQAQKTSTIVKLQKDISSVNSALKTAEKNQNDAQASKAEACSFASQEQQELSKLKVTVSLPTVCQ